MEEDNNISTQEQQSTTTDAQQQTAPKAKTGWFRYLIEGKFFQSKLVHKNGKMLALVVGYLLVAIYLRYTVEDLTKEKIEAQDRINLLREKKIEMQKRYQETIKISKIAEMLDSSGVGITAGPPYEI